MSRTIRPSETIVTINEHGETILVYKLVDYHHPHSFEMPEIVWKTEAGYEVKQIGEDEFEVILSGAKLTRVEFQS